MRNKQKHHRHGEKKLLWRFPVIVVHLGIPVGCFICGIAFTYLQMPNLIKFLIFSTFHDIKDNLRLA